MTTEHYAWIKSQVRQEIEGTPTSSIWLAIALALASLGAALWVAALTTHPGNATKGKIEVAAWAALVLAGCFGLFHLVMWTGLKKRATALIEAMDIHCFYAPVPAAVEASARTSLGGSAIEVISARYGNPADHEALRKNVTQIVRALVSNGKLDFTADNSTFGVIPLQMSSRPWRSNIGLRGTRRCTAERSKKVRRLYSRSTPVRGVHWMSSPPSRRLRRFSS